MAQRVDWMAGSAVNLYRGSKPASGGPGLLTVTIKDTVALHQAYMPFLKNGGLFVPTATDYQLGDEVFMLLSLVDGQKIAVAGRVVWVTPKGCFGRRPTGIGVQFCDQDRGQTQKHIENCLAGALGGQNPTHTM